MGASLLALAKSIYYRLCQVTEQAITRAFVEDCHCIPNYTLRVDELDEGLQGS